MTVDQKYVQFTFQNLFINEHPNALIIIYLNSYFHFGFSAVSPIHPPIFTPIVKKIQKYEHNFRKLN